MQVFELRNGIKENRNFDKFKIQSVYQSTDMLKNVSSIRYILTCGARIRSFVVKQGNEDILLIHTRIKKGTCYLLGEIEGFEVVDCIYGDISMDTLCKALDTFLIYLKNIGVKEFYIKYLNESSNTYKALKNFIDKYKYIEIDIENVSINFNSQTYDDYFSSLKSHVRQNIRTAYNRLEKDNKKLEFVFKSNENKILDKKIAHLKCMKVYTNRLGDRYHNRLLYQFMHYSDYISNGVIKKDGVICMIKINGKIAAFLYGFIDKHSILVPRLAINNEFKFYSPGFILCNELIKKMYKMGGILAA